MYLAERGAEGVNTLKKEFLNFLLDSYRDFFFFRSKNGGLVHTFFILRIALHKNFFDRHQDENSLSKKFNSLCIFVKSRSMKPEI